jgi:hypothetical protein
MKSIKKTANSMHLIDRKIPMPRDKRNAITPPAQKSLNSGSVFLYLKAVPKEKTDAKKDIIKRYKNKKNSWFGV